MDQHDLSHRDFHTVGIVHWDTRNSEDYDVVGKWEIEPMHVRGIENWFHENYFEKNKPVPLVLTQIWSIVSETVYSQWSDQGFYEGLKGNQPASGLPERHQRPYNFGFHAGAVAHEIRQKG